MGILTKEQIKFAEECGLTYTGDEKVPFIGDNLAWSKYNDGDNYLK